MSLTEKLKSNKIIDFIGPDGYRVLSKAINHAFQKTDDVDSVIDDLQIKSRALCSWLQKVSKTLQDTGDGYKSKIPSTDYQFELVKADTALFSGILYKDGSILEEYVGLELPIIASQLMALPEFEQDLNKSQGKSDLKQVQEVVDFLVQEFLFPDKRHNSVILNKSETFAKCDDCGETLKVSADKVKLCVCYKIMGSNSLHIAKNENGSMKLTFGKNWNKENIYLFTKALKNVLVQ